MPFPTIPQQINRWFYPNINCRDFSNIYFTFYIVFVLALKIHISLEMKKALDEVGGFRTEHRGFVDIKVSLF